MATNKDFIVKNGLSVGEDISVSGSVTSHLQFDDNIQAQFGNNSDLQIYSDDTHSYIQESSTQGLRITSDNSVAIRKHDDENIALFNVDGAVRLYHDSFEKFSTSSTGINVTGNAVLTGELRGPASFVIDPAAVGDNTGEVVIKGDLTVEGTTTTVNSTQLDVADKVITVASGSADAAASSGAGITVDVGTNNPAVTAPTITYNATTDRWEFNKAIDPSGTVFFNSDLRASNVSDKLIVKADGTTTEIHASGTGGIVFKDAGNGQRATLSVGGDFTTSGTISGGNFSGINMGGSLTGTHTNAKVQYGTSFTGTPAQGHFFFDSLNQKLKVYTGSAFVDAVPAGGGGGGGSGSSDATATFRKYTYTLTGTTNAISGKEDDEVTTGDFISGRLYEITVVGDTDFTAIGASSNAIGVQFTATDVGGGTTGKAKEVLFYTTGGTQNIEVYVNGVKAVEGASNDYVATTGTSVTFTSNLVSGDVVDIQVYELLTNDSYYLKTQTYTQAEVNSQITTGLSSYIAYTDTSAARTFTIDGTGTTGKDAVLVLKSDSPEASEDANGRIIFNQDGNIDMSAIGMNLNVTGKHATSGNELIIANSTSTGAGIRLATGTSNGYTNATTRFHVTPSGQILMGRDGTGDIQIDDIPGTAHDDVVLIGQGHIIHNDNNMTYGFYDDVGSMPSARMLYNTGARALDFYTSNSVGTAEAMHLRIDSVGRITSTQSGGIGATTSTSQFNLVYNGTPQTEVTASISNLVLTVTATTSGALTAGMYIWGAGVKPMTMIVSDLGSNQYSINQQQTVSSTTMYAKDYNWGTIALSDADTTATANQPLGSLIFKSSDSDGEGNTQPKAFVAATAFDDTPDVNLHFGTHRAAENGIAAMQRLTVWYDGTVHVGESNHKSNHGKLVVQGDAYDSFVDNHTVHEYLYAKPGLGLAVEGTESAIDIIGEDDGNHAASLLLRGENSGFGVVHDPSTSKLRFKRFVSSADDFFIHSTGQNVSTLRDVFSIEADGDAQVYGNLQAEGLVIDSDMNADDSAPTRVDLCNTSNEDPSIRIGFREGSYVADLTQHNMYIEYNGGTADADGSDGHLVIGGYAQANSMGNINSTPNVDMLIVTRAGNIYPGSNGHQDFGRTDARWANVYTSDLHLSNEAKGPNDIDGTTGDWTIVEGEDELYIKNNKTGKKYAFMLKEIE